MATLDSIAEEIGYSRNELMQSMVKFGLTNRDWRNEGLTAHKRLPRYEENPMATKPPSPAQLAARERFAEMARSGSLNRKRQIAAKKRAANPVETEMRYQIFRSNGGIDSTYKTLAQMKNALDEIDNPPGKFYGYDSVTGTTYRSFAYNTPTRKRNPDTPGLYDNINAKRARIAAGSGERMRRPGTKGAPTEEAFKRSAMTAKPRKSNPAKDQRGTPKVRTGYIIEDGEVQIVPIMESFRYQIGLTPHNFFVRSHGGYNMVFEKSTGLAIGKIPYRLTLQGSMTDAAKSYLAAVVKKVGAREFNNAIAKAPTVEDRIENELIYAELTE